MSSVPRDIRSLARTLGMMEKRTPGDCPRTGERRPCQPLEGPGRERKRSNSGDSLRWQISLPGLATDDAKIEIPPY